MEKPVLGEPEHIKTEKGQNIADLNSSEMLASFFEQKLHTFGRTVLWQAMQAA